MKRILSALAMFPLMVLIAVIYHGMELCGDVSDLFTDMRRDIRKGDPNDRA